ncbi:MAG: DUF4280 domain-containing protein [Dysgonomonas sp.]
MSEKAIVVQGAICKCQFGSAPDKIKVLSHQKEFVNDSDGADKMIVTTKEIGGATLEMNCFGTCPKLGSPPPPCKPVITEWTDYYEEVVLSNGGYIIHEGSKAVCAISGTPCIEIIHHGQISEPCPQNFNNANEDVQGQLNPMVDITEMDLPERTNDGIIIN